MIEIKLTRSKPGARIEVKMIIDLIAAQTLSTDQFERISKAAKDAIRIIENLKPSGATSERRASQYHNYGPQ